MKELITPPLRDDNRTAAARITDRGPAGARTRRLRLAAPMLSAALLAAASAEAAPAFVKEGRAGFVVSHIKYALGAGDDAEACPDGTSLSNSDLFKATAAGKRRPGESDGDYSQRLLMGASAMGNGPNGEDFCMEPEAAPVDSHFRTVQGNVPVRGIDLDGASSTVKPASCPHAEFAGVNGGQGIDNQFYRAVGCTRSFQAGGQSNGYEVEMLSGSWGILIDVSGIDDIRNDPEVEVGIYANADPIRLSPTREPLEYATYAVDQNSRFRAQTKGQIKDGVLTTEPVDVRFRHVVNSIRLERPLRDARLTMTLSEAGVLSGYLAGYTPVEEMYDMQFGFRSGKDGSGAPAPLRLRTRSAHGAAGVLGYTCPGVYQALHRLADGHPDPETGQCTSLSTQYELEAIPAFVVDIKTESTNEVLGVQQRAEP